MNKRPRGIQGRISVFDGSAEVGRRRFLFETGAGLFSITVLGRFGGTIPIAATDITCAPPPDHQEDESCSSSSPDQACHVRITQNSYYHDEDQHCSQTSADAACHINSDPTGSTKDSDAHCGANNDPDNGCGDCDDNHDTDDHCGNQSSGPMVYDKDELCGHAHYISYDEDDVCGKQMPMSGRAPDEGCGIHDTAYNEETDPDNNCGNRISQSSVDVDSNCSASPPDQACGQSPPAYASSPDESCSSTSLDEACGNAGTAGYNRAYDKDASCAGTIANNVDNACGATAGPINWDTDDLCSQTSPDGSCNLGPIGETDESCSATNRDEACSIFDTDQHRR